MKHPLVPVTPNYTEYWTIAQANKELEGFEFTGPGWYEYNGSFILIMNIERNPEKMWNSAYRIGERFNFYFWNGANPAETFNLIFNAPTRV